MNIKRIFGRVMNALPYAVADILWIFIVVCGLALCFGILAGCMLFFQDFCLGLTPAWYETASMIVLCILIAVAIVTSD